MLEDEHPSTAYGIVTGEYLLVLDVDVKADKNGFLAIEKVEKELGLSLQDTRIIETASAGAEHRYFKVTQAQRDAYNFHRDTSGKLIGPGVDVLYGSSYLIGEGSVTKAGSYRVKNNVEPAVLPEALAKWLCRGKLSAVNSSPTEFADGLDRSEAGIQSKKARALEHLKTEAPAVSGQGGDSHTVVTANVIGDFGLNVDEAFEVMSDEWNQRCSPPWDAAELKKKIKSAFKSRQNAIGCMARELIFHSDAGAPAPECVTELNKNHAFILEGGQALILREQPENSESPYQLLSPEAFKLALKNRTVPFGQGKKCIADIFLESPHRQQFLGGMGLYPGGAPEGHYNLWRGFAISPKRGNWTLFKRHLREIICGGNESSYQWLIGWIARLFQWPDKVGQVAVVLKGPQGTGKSIVGNAIAMIFGRHAITVVNPRHLIGNFNHHNRDKCLLVGEEAFWQGSREAVSVLKVLITEEKTVYEGKGKNVVTGKNCISMILTSNEAHAVSIDADDRRYAIFDVQNSFAHKREYFDPLLREMENGGLAALLFDCLEMDLSAYNVFDKPRTEALGLEKVRSLRGVDLWLFEILSEGSMPGAIGTESDTSSLFGNVDWDCKAVKVSRTQLYKEYVGSCNSRREYKPESAILWRKRINDILGTVLYEVRDRVPCGREYRLVFAPLSECRKAFENHLRVDGLPWTDLDPLGPNGLGGDHDMLT